MGSKTVFLSTVNTVCSTKGFCKSFQGPWTFELLPRSSVRLLLLLPWPGSVDFALVVTGLERSQSKTPPCPQLFVIHYLLLSCSWQTSLSDGSYCPVSELGPVSCDCLLPVLLVSFFFFSWEFTAICTRITAVAGGKGVRCCVHAFTWSALCQLNTQMC